ncbi:coatomer subunit beta'-like [Artemia franciscana]
MFSKCSKSNSRLKMNLKLDYRHILTARSDRVKCVDLHPTEPWMLVSLYNGMIHVWNHQNQQLIKTFEVCYSPVRSGKFIARKNWIITGSDDYRIRVFNYNTLERQHAVDAHKNYIRCLAVHPTLPIVLSGSDDMKIKMWNWDNSWTCQKVFDGHSHYVMQIVFNPKDNNTFASASLDKTIKIWQLASSIPNFTLKGHVNYITCLDYTHAGQKPYLISGADDCLVKIWDYQNRSCVQSLYGHTENISAVVFHPELPIIITGSEDGTVKIWNATTYSLQKTLNYGLGRAFTICCLKGSNMVDIGFDDGCVMIRLGKEDPTFSMDEGGKILWIKNSEIEMVNLKQFANENIKDGERLNLSVKGDAKSSEVFANTLAHNSDGRYVAVCGGGEYIIYTAMALRNKAYGSALEFV